MLEKISKENIKPEIIEKENIWKENIKTYEKNKNLQIISDSLYLGHPSDKQENKKIIQFRMTLTDLEGKINNSGKYVLLQTYYEKDFGTIDLVKLPEYEHKDIKQEYLENILTKNISTQDLLEDYQNSRFLTAGGFIEQNPLKFNGKSQVFSGKLSTYNVNDIATYLTTFSNKINIEGNNTEKGKEYLLKCLNNMKTENIEKFYENLNEFYLTDIMQSTEFKGMDKMPGPNIAPALNKIEQEHSLKKY